MKSLRPLSKTKFSYLRRLLLKRSRLERGMFLVEGKRSVEDALASGWRVEMILATVRFADSQRDFLRRLTRHTSGFGGHDADIYSIPESSLAQISDTEHAQGLIAVVHEKRYASAFLDSVRDGVVVAVDEISEPGNLGAVIRTCDWFGVKAVIVSKNSVELFNPKVIRATAGSIFHVPIVAGVDVQSALRLFRKRGFQVYATVVEDGVPITKMRWFPRGVLVLGNEARGVSDELRKIADASIAIPRIGRAESLNVGVACGVILAGMSWEAAKQS